MTSIRHRGSHRRTGLLRRFFIEPLEDRRLLAAVTLDPSTVFQTVQGWGSAPLYPDGASIATIGSIMRDAGFNTVRVTAGAGDLTYNKSGDMSTPVPLSSDLNANVPLFGSNGMTQQANLIKWLVTNGLEPERIRMTGSIWSPPHWLKIPTGELITWTNWDGTTHQDYGPFLPYGQYGANTGGGRVDPAKYVDLARFVLSDIKAWEQQAGLPMYALNFQNEPDVETFYSSTSYSHIAKDLSDLSKGYDSGQWQLYANALQAIASERASHPEITTKLYGPELSSLGPSPSNPWFISEYNQIRQKMIANGSLSSLGGYGIHGYMSPKDGEAALWDAFYNGSAHAARILSGGTSDVLGWLWPIPGVGGDGKEIWQTETGSESNTWTKDGALGYGLKIHNALVYGNVSGYTVWELASYNAGDTSGLVDYGDLNNPTNSFNYDAMKQFSRWIRPGAQRINAVFENGKASIGGANELDTYNGLNVSAFNHVQDQRLTMVLVNMQTSSQSTTITIPASLNVASFQVFETTGTQKYVQLANLTPSSGQISLTVPASSIVTITGIYGAPTLPPGWSSSDVGAPSLAGSSSETGGTFTLTGAGNDIWNSADQFQYAYQNLSGDGTITARVNGMQNTNSWAKAGVMFRNTLDAGSINALMAITPGNGVTFQYRSSANGSSNFSNNTGYTAPYWVRITRSGNNFTGYRSADGITWTPVGSTITLDMNSTVYVGLAVTSHSSGATCTSVFDNVTVTTPDTTPPSVTINQAASQLDPASASPINFSVVFSEPVTDFAAGDVSLSGTAGATTAVVTGSGTTYNVAVSGMTADGTIIASLSTGVAHDAAGNASSASTSTDNTVTFTTPTHTWSGLGANNNWSTALNWAENMAPSAGDNLIFPAGTARLESKNDYPTTVFGSITVSGSGYVFTDNGLAVTNNVLVQSGGQLTVTSITAESMTIGGASSAMNSVASVAWAPFYRKLPQTAASYSAFAFLIDPPKAPNPRDVATESAWSGVSIPPVKTIVPPIPSVECATASTWEIASTSPLLQAGEESAALPRRCRPFTRTLAPQLCEEANFAYESAESFNGSFVRQNRSQDSIHHEIAAFLTPPKKQQSISCAGDQAIRSLAMQSLAREFCQGNKQNIDLPVGYHFPGLDKLVKKAVDELHSQLTIVIE